MWDVFDAARDEDDDEENAREAELVVFDNTTQGLGNVCTSVYFGVAGVGVDD